MAALPWLAPWDGGQDLDIPEHLQGESEPIDDRRYEHVPPDHHKEWQ